MSAAYQYDRGLVSELLRDPTSVKADPLLDAALDVIRETGRLESLTVDGLLVSHRYLPYVVSELVSRGIVLRSVETPINRPVLHAKPAGKAGNESRAYFPKGTIAARCLGCGAPFKSVSRRTNRLCDACTATN